jgi:hypothetical protein
MTGRCCIGVEDPLGSAAGDRRGVTGTAGDRDQAGDRDVAAGLGKPCGGEFLGVVPPLR